MRLILGSSSKYRQKVLRDMGLDFEIVSPDIDEKAIRFDDPEELTMAIATAKNEAVCRQLTEPAIVITSDQVVVQDGEILEKPQTEAEARRYLGMAGHTPVETVGAFVVTNTATGKTATGRDRVKILMHPLMTETIDAYIAADTYRLTAGGFQVEHPLISPNIISIDGELESVMGLSPKVVRRLLDEVGHS